MVAVKYSQTNFNGGLVSEKVRGRPDTNQFYNSLVKCHNFIPMATGEIRRRPPTAFVSRTENFTDDVKLIPFIVDDDTQYQLEFGDDYVRLYNQDKELVTNPADANQSLRTFDNTQKQAVNTLTRSGTTLSVALGINHNITINDPVYLSGSDEENYTGFFTVSGVPSSTTFEVTLSSATGATSGAVPGFWVSYESSNFTDGGSSPYTYAQATDIDYAQSIDIMYTAHKDVFPKQLRRVDTDIFVWEDYDFQDGPWEDPNDNDDFRLEVSAKTGTTNITATGTGHAPFVGTGSFSADDVWVGRLVRIRFVDSAASDPKPFIWGSAKITSITSSTVAVAEVQEGYPFGRTAVGTRNFRYGAWSVANGYPSKVSFHQQRLVWAHSPAEPETFWTTVSGDFDTFSPTLPGNGQPESITSVTDTTGAVVQVSRTSDADFGDHVQTDDSAITYTLSSNTISKIVWMESREDLIIGTTAGIFIARTDENSGKITPANIQATRHLNTPCADTSPVFAKGNILFLDTSRTKLWELDFEPGARSPQAVDLMLLNESIAENKIKDLQYIQVYESIVWCLLENGSLLSLTYEPEQKVRAWATHSLGGNTPNIKSMSSIKDADTGRDELWLAVKRLVPSNEVRIEYMEDFVDTELTVSNYQRDYNFLDSSVRIPAAPNPIQVSNFTNTDLTVLGDGLNLGEFTSNGSGFITLPQQYAYVITGHNYESYFETLDLVSHDQKRSSIGSRSRITHVTLSWDKSIFGKYGPDSSRLREIPAVSSTTIMGSLPDYSTFTKRLRFSGGNTRLGSKVYVKQDKPYPLTILQLEFEGYINI